MRPHPNTTEPANDAPTASSGGGVCRFWDTLPAMEEVRQGRLMDLRGVAEYLGITERQARHLAEQDRIPVTRIDGRLRFDIWAIDKWIARSTSKPTPR